MLVPPESKPRGVSVWAREKGTTSTGVGPRGNGAVVKLRFPSRRKWTREHSDDPRVYCRWWLARGISINHAVELMRLPVRALLCSNFDALPPHRQSAPGCVHKRSRIMSLRQGGSSRKDRIVRRFDSLSPYDRTIVPDLLRLTKQNFNRNKIQRQL